MGTSGKPKQNNNTKKICLLVLHGDRLLENNTLHEYLDEFTSNGLDIITYSKLNWKRWNAGTASMY